MTNMNLESMLLDSALRGSALLVAAALIVLAMKKQSAARRHLVWTVGLAALLVAPLIVAILPSWEILPASAAPAVTLPASNEVPAAAEPLPADFALLDAGETSVPAMPLWFRIWLGGTALLMARFLFAQVKLALIAHRARPVPAGDLADMFGGLCRQFGISRPVRLVIGKPRAMPMTWGTLRPVLLLPAEAESWDPARQHAVLCHELAHINRGDAGTGLIAQLAIASHWFNPLVWLAAHRANVERERACDDLVLAQGWRASDYAGHLLHVVTGVGQRPAIGAVAMAANRSNMGGRIEAILREGVNRNAASRRAAVVLIALGLATAIPVMLASAKAQDDEAARVMIEGMVSKDGKFVTIDGETIKLRDIGKSIPGLGPGGDGQPTFRIALTTEPGTPQSVFDRIVETLNPQGVADFSLTMSELDTPVAADPFGRPALAEPISAELKQNSHDIQIEISKDGKRATVNGRQMSLDEFAARLSKNKPKKQTGVEVTPHHSTPAAALKRVADALKEAGIRKVSLKAPIATVTSEPRNEPRDAARDPFAGDVAPPDAPEPAADPFGGAPPRGDAKPAQDPFAGDPFAADAPPRFPNAAPGTVVARISNDGENVTTMGRTMSMADFGKLIAAHPPRKAAQFVVLAEPETPYQNVTKALEYLQDAGVTNVSIGRKPKANPAPAADPFGAGGSSPAAGLFAADAPGAGAADPFGAPAEPAAPRIGPAELASPPEGNYMLTLVFGEDRVKTAWVIKGGSALCVKADRNVGARVFEGTSGRFQKVAAGAFQIQMRGEGYNANQTWVFQADGSAKVLEVPDRGENQRAVPVSVKS